VKARAWVHTPARLTAGFPEVTDRSRELLGRSSFFMEKESTKGKNMGILWLVLFVVVWVALQAYILPKMGIST
jgi:hypothetical protein